MAVDRGSLALSVVDAIDIGLVLVEPDDMIVFANRAAATLLGAAAAVGERLRDARADLPRPDDRRCRGAWLSLSAGGPGAPTAIDVTVVPAGERFIYCLRAGAATAGAEPGRLAGLGHELRTPLNAIIGFAEVIDGAALGPGAGDRYRQYAADIARSGRHVLSLIDDALRADTASPGAALDERPCDLAEVAETAASIVAGTLAGRNVSLACNVPPAALAIVADAKLLRQVAINLLSNAVNSVGDAGHVSIAAYIDDAGRPTLRVRDDGAGIDPALLPDLTKPYVRGAGAAPGHPDEHGHGEHGHGEHGHGEHGDGEHGDGEHGLGLFLVARHVDLHGGSLRFDSAPGAGTTVTVTLPAARRRRNAT